MLGAEQFGCRQRANRRHRMQRGSAVEELVEMQEEYREWLDRIPDAIRDAAGPTVDRLEAMEPPRGFGRDDC